MGKPLTYISTRGKAPELSFEDVLLQGLASDGGLYVPTDWPIVFHRDLGQMGNESYAKIAEKVLTPFIGDMLGADELSALLEDTYKDFAHPAVTPLRQLDHGEWLLELFHGPTLAFKDLAMQLLGRLFDIALERRGQTVTLIGATSGDTGGAAIEAMRGLSRVRIIILHPHGRVSDVQRRQMTTVTDPNVHNIALEGTFDDCQRIVKEMFADEAMRKDFNLGGVNSINWARVMGQIVYYFVSALALGGPHRAIQFSVPTGNFGDIFAGYVAKQMGLPISHLIIGTNQNDILTRTLETKAYEVKGVTATMSPSIDIQVSSNFERLLFEVERRHPEKVEAYMKDLSATGRFELSTAAWGAISRTFSAASVNEEETLDTIRSVYASTGIVLDPHSAVGVAAGRKKRQPGTSPLVHLATAHPAKFPDAVEKAIGLRPSLPPHLSDLLDRPEAFDVLPNDTDAVKTYVRENAQ